MRVRTFKPPFAPLVKSGAKRQTIRPMPKRLPKAGDIESWREWSALPYRSRQRELARVQLTSVDFIQIFETGVAINGKLLTPRQVGKLSGRDGFPALRLSFLCFFWDNYGLPFSGILIRAKDLQ